MSHDGSPLLSEQVYDTFTSQGKFYVASEEVSENVYNRVQVLREQARSHLEAYVRRNALLDEIERVVFEFEMPDRLDYVAELLSKRVKPCTCGDDSRNACSECVMP